MVWAPVNCGYHSTDYPYGKLYQWGRKHGQGYAGFIWINGEISHKVYDASYPISNVVYGQVSNTIGNNSSNMYNFYKSDEDNYYDWCSHHLTEWASEYDPCPEGWRVPTEFELRKLQKNYSNWTTNNGTEGCWFSGNKSYSSSGDAKVFFPAAGARGYDGVAYFGNRGSCGFYWSSSVSGENSAHRLCFQGGYVRMDSHYRASGYSVRCVEDL